MSVKAATVQALRGAMERLLRGEPSRTDGSLTWNNVCAEAGVPRATAARASDLIAEWQTSLRTRVAAPCDHPVGHERIALAEERARREAMTNEELRDTVKVMANKIQALTLGLEQRDRVIGELRRTQPNGPAENVVGIRDTMGRGGRAGR
jgi:hypothetical protein